MPEFYSYSSLLLDYWIRRKYHHTILGARMVYALSEALAEVED